MKKTIVFLTTSALAIVMALALVVSIKTVKAQQPPVEAFQLWTHAVGPDVASPGQTYVVDTYMARRSDGAEFIKNSAGNSWLKLPAKGIVIEYHNGLQATWGYGKPIRVVDNSSCEGTTEGKVVPGNTNLLGLDTLHLHGSVTPGANISLVFDKWLSLDVDCRSLSELSQEYDKEGKLLRTDKVEATKVVLGEPPSDVFLPASLPEGTPSQLVATDRATPMTPGRSKRLERQDKQYNYQKAVREGRAPVPVPKPIVVKVK